MSGPVAAATLNAVVLRLCLTGLQIAVSLAKGEKGREKREHTAEGERKAHAGLRVISAPQRAPRLRAGPNPSRHLQSCFHACT